VHHRIVLVTRCPDIDYEEFHHGWQMVHAPLLIPSVNLRGYVQDRPVVAQRGRGLYDAVTERRELPRVSEKVLIQQLRELVRDGLVHVSPRHRPDRGGGGRAGLQLRRLLGTVRGVMRVGGNKKSVFTRERRPKAAAYVLRRRWQDLRSAPPAFTCPSAGVHPRCEDRRAGAEPTGPTSQEATWRNSR
jgi:hypothetical protein